MHLALRETLLKIAADIFTTSDKTKLNTARSSKIALGNFPGIWLGIAPQQQSRYRLPGGNPSG